MTKPNATVTSASTTSSMNGKATVTPSPDTRETVTTSTSQGRQLGKAPRRQPPPRMADVIGLASTPSAYVETGSHDSGAAGPDTNADTGLTSDGNGSPVRGDNHEQAPESPKAPKAMPDQGPAELQNNARTTISEAESEDRVVDVGAPRPPIGRLVPTGPLANSAAPQMPDSVRKALRLSINNLVRAVNAALRLVETRQRELVDGLIEARNLGFPPGEIERIRGEALGLGFTAEDFDELLRATGWHTSRA